MHRARRTAASRVIRTRPAIAMVVAAAGLATAIWLPSRFDNAEATEGTSGELRDRVVFEDTFDGDELDREKWTPVTGPVEEELQVFTDRGRNLKLDDEGNLVITARRDRDRGFTSARVMTRESFAAESGRVEARIQLAGGKGIRSVFQLLGADPGDATDPTDPGDATDATDPADAADPADPADATDPADPADVMDVMENFGDKSTVVHAALGDRDGSFESDQSFTADFHTFSVDWAPGQTVWSVDGEEFLRTDETLDGPVTPSVALTVGGDEAGRPDDSTRLPQRMRVTHVRVTVREDAEQEPPTATAPTSGPTTEPATPPTSGPATEPTAPSTTPPTTPPTTVPTSQPAPPPATTAPPALAARAWKAFTLYSSGDRVTFGGRTYEVRETHTSLPAWTPPSVPGLFKAL